MRPKLTRPGAHPRPLVLLVAATFLLASSARLYPQTEPAYKQRAQRFLRGRDSRSTPEALTEARRQHAALAQTPHPNANLSTPWQPAGPNQIASLAYGNVTGRITSVAIDPADATGNTVYLGTTGGGVWKSTNAAAPAANVQFLPLTDTLPVFSANSGTSALPSLSIGALAIQPTGGQNAVILAGTGDPNDATDSYYGSGILRSVDGGSTWTLAQGSRDGVAGNHSFLGLGTAAFAWSTTTPNLVVAAMSQSAEGTLVNAPDATNSVLGLYYSTDAGTTWQMATIADGAQIVQRPLPSGANNGGNAATAVVWNPLRQVFLAAVRFHGIYQSADGVTWSRLATQPGTGLTAAACPTNPNGTGSPTCPLFRAALAVQPLSGDTYALAVDRNNLDQGLWQAPCTPAGQACTAANVAFTTRLTDTILEQGSGSTAIPQADYDLALAATPAASGDTANTVLYAGTIDLYRCAFPNGNPTACLLRNTTNALNGCAAPAQVAPAQHTLATLALTQPLVFLGNDGGLWRSPDGVAQTGTACSPSAATHFENLNSSLGSLAESVSLAAHPTDPNTLLLGVGANGTALTSAASSLSPWPQLAAGEGGTVAIDQANPLNLYLSTGPGVSITHCAKGSACTAADFTGPPTLGPTQVANDASLVDAPFLLDPALQSDILIGTCRVRRGPAADGAQWSSANALSKPFGGPANTTCDATTNPLVRSLAASGPASGATAAQNAGSTILYAGLAGALDGGLNLGGHLFATTAGATAGPTTAWTDTARTNVTNDAADAGRFNPGAFDLSSVTPDPHDASGKTVYATVMGFAGNGINAPHLYRSLDAGTTWINISSNLPNAPANSLAIDPNDANTLYVALDTGVYVTTQVATCASTNCWSVFGTGLPNAPVIQLVATPGLPTGDGRLGQLRAATYGRGVWQLPLLTAHPPAAPVITLSPTALTFPAQAVSTQSPPQAVTVTNTGTAPLIVPSITTTGDFTETDTCTTPAANTFAPGATCTIQVRFLPTAAGPRSGILTVFGNAPGGQSTVSLNGTATPPAAIVLNPLALTFPTTNVGATSAPLNLTISNTGGSPAALQTPTVSAPDFRISANTCTATLPPQTGCTVSLTFTPTAAGPRTGTFSITDDAGTQTASLSGTATNPATDTLTPLALTFGPQVLNTASPTQSVTLTNDGDVPLTLIAATITSGDFTVVNNCGNSLNPHSACTLQVAYVPKALGPETGTLTVSDQFRSQTVALNGTGLAPAGVSLAPFAGLTFPATPVNTASAPQTVTLTNNGGIPLTLSGIALTGDFATTTNTCPTTLPPATACTLQVTSTPLASGPRTGLLTVTDSAPNSPQTLPLSGPGVDFTLTNNGPTTLTVPSGTSAVFPLLLLSAPGTPGTVTFTCLGAPTNATCLILPANPAFGTTTIIAVTIATGVTGQTTQSPATSTNTPHAPTHRTLWLAALLPLAALTLRRRRLHPRPILLASLALALSQLAGCGVGRQIPPGTNTTPSGPITPSGAYSIAVSATSAGLTRSLNLTLIVQ